ncbi:MAG: hypothetical protein H6916_05260 [Novosphingobium sp.]|uniref:hypothetical protein n=1 Tax=Novosphingobium sp. TaxID=1874826 RepID=UPI00261AB490|nr:hypothetical protein [Novosphingobium sp.]MCP5386212.1 hypothetical protein [Novosphingobium sp.]
MRHSSIPFALALALVLTPACAVAKAADSLPAAPSSAATYADLADLTDHAPLVIRAQVRKLVAVDPARAPGLRAGQGRFYVEARTQAVLFGSSGLGEQLRYLVDLPLDAKGKPPKLRKQTVILFARPVASRPGELQLVARDAQLAWDSVLEGRLGKVIAELNAPGAIQAISGLREAISIGGDLAGESDTQLFLATADGEPAAITVSRSPGRAPRWSVSFSELVGDDSSVPARDTLAWYRLACFLPPALPAGVITSSTAPDRARAAADYRFVLEQLGPCPRSRS